MNAALKRRIAVLESLGVNDGWLVLESNSDHPSPSQLNEMKTAHEKGRMALIFLGTDLIWVYGFHQFWKPFDDAIIASCT